MKLLKIITSAALIASLASGGLSVFAADEDAALESEVVDVNRYGG